MLADDVERVDARGTVTGRTQVLAEFGQSTLSPDFAVGTWSGPEVDGDVVTSTCTFQPGAPWPGATVKVTVTADGKISRVDTGPSNAGEGSSAADQGGSGGLAMSADLERIVRDVLHLTPTRVRSVPTQSGTRVHRVVTDEHVVYVKLGRTADTGGRFRLEAWAHEQCRAKGVLVPEVLAASEPDDELDYMATPAPRRTSDRAAGDCRSTDGDW